MSTFTKFAFKSCVTDKTLSKERSAFEKVLLYVETAVVIVEPSENFTPPPVVSIVPATLTLPVESKSILLASFVVVTAPSLTLSASPALSAVVAEVAVRADPAEIA